MDAAMLERVRKLLGQTRENLRACQSAAARTTASVYLLEQLVGDLERAAAAAAPKAVQ